MCKKKEACIGKTVGDNIVGFKSRMNQQVWLEKQMLKRTIF